MGTIELHAPPTTPLVDDAMPETAMPEPVMSESGQDEGPSEPDQPASRRRLVGIVAVVVGLVMVVGGGFLIWLLLREPSPRPPESLRIEMTQATSVSLEWDAPGDGPDPESYVVLLGEQELASVDAPATSFVAGALSPNTRYEFAVVSVDGDRRSEPSEAIAVTTDPDRPTSLRIEDHAATTVRLQWDAPPGPSVDAYVVLLGEQELDTVDAPATSFVAGALSPNTRYEFAVVSVDGDRRSEPSETIVVTTDPGRPFMFRAEDPAATTVRLQWDAPPGPSADSYVISNEGDELGVVQHPETSFMITDLIPGASYDFSVVAQDGLRRSVPAMTSVTTIAPRPGGLMSDPAGNTIDTIVLTWSPPADAGPPTEYLVFRNGEPVATVPGNTPTYTDTGLAPGTLYEYRVAANWGYEPSVHTDAIPVATVEPPIGDARLVGSWPVNVTIVKDPGGNLDVGTAWTTTWDFEPSCDAGACDVTLSGNNDPPGFTYKSFTVALIRDGASYTGSGTAQITFCNTVAVENTVTVRLTVDTAAADGGGWLATSWTGTLEIASPYTQDGQYYCGAQTVREDLSAAR